MPEFAIASEFQMTGDQPHAVERLSRGVMDGVTRQTLMGVTGSRRLWRIQALLTPNTHSDEESGSGRRPKLLQGQPDAVLQSRLR